MPSIEIQSNDPAHKAAVEEVIAKAEKSAVGKVLLADMEATKKKLIIKPYDGSDPVFGPCNASTRALSPADSAPDGVGAAPQAPFYRGNPDSIYTTDKDERFDLAPPGLIGTGKGSSVDLYFSPNVIREKNCYGGKSGSAPDEMFIHELVHVLRIMQGMRNPYPTKNFNYMNEEEFLAIVTANVYISEKGSSDLRRDYDGHDQLQAPLNTSSGFLADRDNLRLMSIQHLIWRPTFRNLAKVITAPFNPFQQLVKDLAYLHGPA